MTRFWQKFDKNGNLGQALVYFDVLSVKVGPEGLLFNNTS